MSCGDPTLHLLLYITFAANMCLYGDVTTYRLLVYCRFCLLALYLASYYRCVVIVIIMDIVKQFLSSYLRCNDVCMFVYWPLWSYYALK